MIVSLGVFASQNTSKWTNMVEVEDCRIIDASDCAMARRSLWLALANGLMSSSFSFHLRETVALICWIGAAGHLEEIILNLLSLFISCGLLRRQGS